MTKHRLLVAAASAALLIGTASFSEAIEVKAGGTSVNVGNGKGGATAATVGGNSGVSAKATVGGGSNTASGSVKAGNATVNATVGGGNNIAKGTVNLGGDKATVSIGTYGTGPLAKVDSNGNPLSGDSLTSGDVDLGNLLGIFSGGIGGIIDDVPGIGGDGTGGRGVIGGGGGSGGGGKGGGGIDSGKVKTIVAGMDAGERAQMKITCRGVLGNPTGYDPKLIQLCRLLVRL